MAFVPMAKLRSIFLIISLVMISRLLVFVAPFQFQVGGDNGWTKPTGNETEGYNEWATKTRFHVGDSLYFKYQQDSVLVVNSTAYDNCIVSNPVSEFVDGNTIFQLDRNGFFFFISGQPGHCNAGQKLVVSVMGQRHDEHGGVEDGTPKPAPSPEENESDGDFWDGFNWGPPALNSTIKSTVASYFMTALGGVLVILYLLM